jgi:hypothetical protein
VCSGHFHFLLDSDVAQGGLDSRRNGRRIVISPEVHKEKARLLRKHVTVSPVWHLATQ